MPGEPGWNPGTFETGPPTYYFEYFWTPPGGDSYPPGNYTAKFGGTSAACPQVSGLAALILSVKPTLEANLANPEVQNIIKITADDLGSPGTDTDFGHGRINANLALVYTLNPQPPPATPQNLVMTNAGQNGENPILVWDANTEPYLAYYQIYRGDQDFPGGPIFWQIVARPTAATWTDPWITIQTSGSATVYYKITAMDQFEQESDYSNTVSTNTNIIPKPSADVPEDASRNLPEEIALHQNYPNPFNPHTQIRFDLPERAHVTLRIYNLLGEEIRTLVDGMQDIGYHNVSWDGKNARGHEVPSGVYLYRIQVERASGDTPVFSDFGKMTLLR